MPAVGHRIGAGGVAADPIPLEDVAGGNAGGTIEKKDAVAVIPGDEVARAGGRPAESVIGSKDLDPSAAVAERRGSRDVGAHIVALHQLPAARGELDPVAKVSRDDIPGSDRCSADLVVGRAVRGEHSVAT